MTITAAKVKELRDATGVGMLDCKKVLETYGGDYDKALEDLRKKGLEKAARKMDRETRIGLVVVKASGDNACAVEVDCETDFVARTDEFKTFAHRLADQLLADSGLTDLESLLAAESAGAPGQTNAAVVQGLIVKLGEKIVVSRAAHLRLAGAGVVESYVHSGELEDFYGPMEGRIGVLIELGAAAVDAVALRRLAHDLALHIASLGPRYLTPGDVPADVVEQERAETLAQIAAEHKPESLKSRIVEGRLNKFYQDVCLSEQLYLRDDSLRIKDLLRQKSAEFGTPVTIRRFARFDVGA